MYNNAQADIKSASRAFILCALAVARGYWQLQKEMKSFEEAANLNASDFKQEQQT